jgi:hypothetical protein
VGKLEGGYSKGCDYWVYALVVINLWDDFGLISW